MNKKIFLFLFLLTIIPLFLFGCVNKNTSMDSVLEIIENSYTNGSLALDMTELNSDKYKKEIEDYLKQLDLNLDLTNINYKFGDLDGDLIPELVLYTGRNLEDLNDQGALVVYKLFDNMYKELDRVAMNYDNSNYIIKIGMLSDNQAGVYLINQVGVEAAVTYGYILEDNKIKNILNPKRVNLISFYSMESIKDINQDGILEFGVLTVDPETEETKVEDAQKIILWYKWDGFDGAIFVRKDDLNSRSLRSIKSFETNDSLNPGSETFIPEMQNNMDNYSKLQLSSLLSSHVKNLEMNSPYNNLDVSGLFSKHLENSSLLGLLEDYNLTKNKINDINYIQNDLILETKTDLKSVLISNLNKGYYLGFSNGSYTYTPYYSEISNMFSKKLTKELQGYLSIMSKSSETPYHNKGVLLIDKIDLAKRLFEIENYKTTYSYSMHIENINILYKDYLFALLFFSTEGEILTDSNIISDNDLDKLVEVVNSYPETYFSQVINDLLVFLNKNQNTLGLEARKKIIQMIR